MKLRLPRRWSGLLLAGGASLLLAACVTSSEPSASSAVQSAASLAENDRLRTRLAGVTLQGGNVAGESFCAAYRADGTLTMAIPGHAEQAGNWTVDDGQVCETVRGLTSCSRFAFLPPDSRSVTITSPDGAFLPYTASVSNGSDCGGARG